MTGRGAKGLGVAAFADLMNQVGPFGATPQIAAAVSGGADSLALCLLLHDWTRQVGGSTVALTVDHGLRPGSADEARQVGRQLRSLGIPHRVLTWRPPQRLGSLQTAAREARYTLLEDWCRQQGVLFLALAHHQDDQAETLLMRLGRGSGLDGLAAMGAVRETPYLRLVRPVLSVPKSSLEATVRERGLSWIEDPSNFDRTHTRIRLRQSLPQLEREGMTAQRLFDSTQHLGRARCALEVEVAALLARAVKLYPAGFAVLEAAPLTSASEDVALRALGRLLVTVGGTEYMPRMERLTRLYRRIEAGLGRGATLGGCRIMSLGDGKLLVAREAGRVQALALQPGRAQLWDGRFEIMLHRTAAGTGPWRVSPLGTLVPNADSVGVFGPGLEWPRAARLALPAISDSQGVAAVPHLGVWRDAASRKAVGFCRFAPKNPLSPPGFTVAYRPRHIIS